MTRCAWGIDPAAAGFAVAVVTDPYPKPVDEALLHVSDHRTTVRRPLETRMAAVHLEALTALHDLADKWPPDIIVLEQPVGRFPTPTLMGGWGALTCACVAVAGQATVWMTPPVWKKAAGLSGGCGKPATLALAVILGYTGVSEDEADATCIAWAGLSRLGAAT